MTQNNIAVMSIGVMQADPALQQSMYTAYDALAAARGKLDSMLAARTNLEAELTAVKAQGEAAKQAYLGGFEASGQTGALTQAAKDAKALATELGGKVAALEDMLRDFAGPIKQAEAEVRAKNLAYRGARDNVARKMAIKPPVISSAVGIDTVPAAGFDLRGAMLAYMLHFDQAILEQGQAFADTVSPPHQFFAFLAQFFRNPARDAMPALRAEVATLIWGNRAPPPEIEVPRP